MGRYESIMSMYGDFIFLPLKITSFSLCNNLYKSEFLALAIIGSSVNFRKTSIFEALPLQPMAFLSSLGLNTNTFCIESVKVSNFDLSIPVDCAMSTKLFPEDPNDIPSIAIILSFEVVFFLISSTIISVSLT